MSERDCSADREGGRDYVLAVKGNPPKLHAALQEHFDRLHEMDFADKTCRRRTTREQAHGRGEDRYYYQSPVPALGEVADEWAGLASVGQVVAITRRDGKETSEVRYYISSLTPGLTRFAQAVRGHWRIENALHWVLDAVFDEDRSRIRKDHGPDHFALLRRFAISLIKQDTTPGSVRRKRKRAAWNNDALEDIVRLTT